MDRFAAHVYPSRMYHDYAPCFSPSLVSTWADETWSRTFPTPARLHSMHPSLPAIQPHVLSKTVKRRNRRRICKMCLKIQEASEGALTLNACTARFAWSTTNAASTVDVGAHDDSNESTEHDDEEARDKAIWNAKTFSSPNSPTRTATPQHSASAQHPPDPRVIYIAPRQPVPRTVQLFPVDIASSVEARELHYVQPDPTQNPVDRLRAILALATRMHARVWPSLK
jgi:hypothetical protein